jgi:hypothetical protein
MPARASGCRWRIEERRSADRWCGGEFAGDADIALDVALGSSSFRVYGSMRNQLVEADGHRLDEVFGVELFLTMTGSSPG